MPRQDHLRRATGNDVYAAKVSAIIAAREATIPSSLRLPASLLEDPPLDVTGIPASCGLLTPEELAITELDATAVVRKIAAGELSAVDTITAFGKRAAIAHQLTACLTDFFLEEGVAQAKALDEYYKNEGKTIGPLHGLPISIKDYIRVKGHVGSGGFLSNYEISTHDSHMVATLRSLGAVFYCKTNQPQTIMHLESHSFHGRTLNPWNTHLTPGGSSGGESALIAMQGSCCGIGSDGGGSVRNPAANTGVYGMRPTAKTTPIDDQIWYQGTQYGFGTSTGPLCRSSRDIGLFFAAINSVKPYLVDPLLIPVVPVVPDLEGKKLRVGIMMHDDVVLPHPPTLRALKLAKEKLLAAPNVEVVDYKPYQHDRGYTIIRTIYYEDGGKTVRKMLADTGEDALPLTEWVISPPITRDHSASEMWELHEQSDVFRREYNAHWNDAGIDVLLCPPFPGTANPHDTAKYWGYTAIFNLLDFPGFVFPTGLRADPAVDVPTEPFAPMSAADEYNHSIYDPAVFVNAPVSLQLIARRFDDGLLIGAQKVVENILRA